MSLRAGLELMRPANCTMIGFAVIVGVFVSKPADVKVVQGALGFLTGFFLCAYSMSTNDIYDVEVDRVNQPERPIPSGRVSTQAAVRLSVLVLVAGVASCVLTLNPAAVGIALLYAFLMWVYNSRAKLTGLPGNLLVASSLAVPFIYGGVVSGGSLTRSLLLMMAFTSFFSGVGREVVKGMADVEGDAKRGVNSVARSRGLRAASSVGAAFFLLAVVTSWVPLALGLANGFYTFGVIVPDAVFAYLAASIVARHDPANAHGVKRIALAGMAVGLIVFVGGAY
ncbi:MAG: geranylgeranylglycerol-phosphate geranylgeranyltransferase [Nitrososphaerales archaeon]|jgi:geranylgeranylglycerol-phosphate geranylgeranyltransferase